MGFIERRRLGVTFVSIFNATKQMLAAGEINPNDDHGLIAALVLTEIVDRTEANAGIDWDGLIRFIEALLPIILALLDALN